MRRKRANQPRRNAGVSEEDARAFRDAVADAKPLRREERRVQRRRAPEPRARFRRADEEQVLSDSLADGVDPAELGTGEELWYHRSGLQQSVMRKLRRGHYRSGAELDLHGMTAAVARSAVSRFLAASRKADIRSVRIVHGKGRGSGPRGPVLKRQLALWLMQRDDVLAFCSARPVDGGTGAVYVLLARG